MENRERERENTKKDWSEYFEITENNPPSELLIKALDFVEHKRKAFDVGGGALKDTKYLLSQGFEVTVIDGSELMEKYAEKMNSDKIHYYVTPFTDFKYPIGEFDIASAMNTLPFNTPETFDQVFENIKNSIVSGGIFCAKLFGVRDGWSDNPTMTFHTKEQVESLLGNLKILYFKENESDGKIADGTPKHWHTFDFIVQK